MMSQMRYSFVVTLLLYSSRDCKDNKPSASFLWFSEYNYLKCPTRLHIKSFRAIIITLWWLLHIDALHQSSAWWLWHQNICSTYDCHWKLLYSGELVQPSPWQGISCKKKMQLHVKWLVAIRQQAITWANVDPDLCCHMVLLGHNGIYSLVRHLPSIPVAGC